MLREKELTMDTKLTPSMLEKNDIIMFTIYRNEIEQCNFERIDDIVFTCFKNPKHSQKKLLLHFEGYDEDERAIMEIDEIRNYITQLFIVFPFLFSILSDFKDHAKAIACCLSNVKIEKQGDVINCFIEPIEAVINAAAQGTFIFFVKLYGYDAYETEIDFNDIQRKKLERELQYILDVFGAEGKVVLPF